jgi:small subunit ribosomal protein S20
LANHKSALKRHKQSLKRAARNRAARTRIKNVVKAVRSAVESKNREQAVPALAAAVSVLDKYAGKAVHWKNAARKVSRLVRAVNPLA